MEDHQSHRKILPGLSRPHIGRRTGVLLMLVTVAVRVTWTAENIGLIPEAAGSSASPTVRSHCTACARYSRPASRREFQHLKPFVAKLMNPSVRRKLLAGLELAVRRVREVHECHDLFSRLGSDGAEKLFKALYFPANTYGELHVCRRSVAFVKMSGSQTWLCRGFAKLSDKQAAITLIHEALHHAGLEEGSKGPTPAEIDWMVMQACRPRASPAQGD